MKMSQVARQPWLHELNVTVLGNVTALSSRSGDMRPDAATGLYVDDRRALSELTVLLDGEPPSEVAARAVGSRAEFLASARNLGSVTPDPAVEVRRLRQLVEGGLLESVSVVSRAAHPLEAVLTIRLASDAAPIGSVKAGRVEAQSLAPSLVGTQARFASGWHTYTALFDPQPERLAVDGSAVVASFDLALRPQEAVHVRLRVTATRRRSSGLDANPGGHLLGWDDVRVTGTDPRLAPTVSASLEDLQALVVTDPDSAEDVFAAAGTPWYLTLFGRDSIWAARLALPFGTTLARGTLRSLARRQGVRADATSAEAPGKIPHEVRRFPYVDPHTGMTLPPAYYGTVDATALWVILLHDAWCWGLPAADVRDLLDTLDAAVGWLLTEGASPDGLLRYVDASGTGLSNQGWKDSGDAVRFRDGSIASAPIALIEAQAYAVSALECAARLRTAFGYAGAEEARERAAALREMIRARFWVPGPTGPYLGIAVDGRGRLVDGLASNMGHVLGTGVLTRREVATLARHLTGAQLLDRYGVRTLAVDNGGFNPIGYHTGSIWTHDTAIVALGLAREGCTDDAVAVARTLLASAEAFDYRWPELYSGAAVLGRPAPYPAACRPQAWAAASAVALVSVALGLAPDAAHRTLHVRAARPAAFGAMRVEGLRFCGGRVDLDVDPAGTVTVLRAASDITVAVHQA